VKEKTGGRLEIQVFHSGQLGQQKDLFLGMQAGNIQMAKMPFTIAAAWVPEAKIFDLPYLFFTREEMWRVLRGTVGKKFFDDIYPRVGLVGIMNTDDGAAAFTPTNPSGSQGTSRGSRSGSLRARSWSRASMPWEQLEQAPPGQRSIWRFNKR